MEAAAAGCAYPTAAPFCVVVMDGDGSLAS